MLPPPTLSLLCMQRPSVLFTEGSLVPVQLGRSGWTSEPAFPNTLRYLPLTRFTGEQWTTFPKLTTAGTGLLAWLWRRGTWVTAKTWWQGALTGTLCLPQPCWFHIKIHEQFSIFYLAAMKQAFAESPLLRDDLELLSCQAMCDRTGDLGISSGQVNTVIFKRI